MCILKNIPQKISEHLKKFPTHSRWKALDLVETKRDINDANACFLKWAKLQTARSQHLILKSFRNFEQSTNDPVYAPASNFGYAKVYFGERNTKITLDKVLLENNTFYFKESFYIDIFGGVYANPLFIMSRGEPKSWSFFSYDYLTDRLQTESFCTKCHNKKETNTILFGRY